jgi:hypothetical protein
MMANRLQMNTDMIAVIRCSSSGRRLQLPHILFRIGADEVSSVHVVRDLGIYLDRDVSMTAHVARTFPSCLALL